VWVTHMFPRLLGPGAPCHSHGWAPYRSPALRGYSFGLILACALAATTQTVEAKKPALATIRARFIVPLRQYVARVNEYVLNVMST
jgi:hypothetical protein